MSNSGAKRLNKKSLILQYVPYNWVDTVTYILRFYLSGVAVQRRQIRIPQNTILRTAGIPLPQTNLHSVIIILPCYIALMGVVSNVQYSVLRREKADTYYSSLDTRDIGRFAAVM
jgi:hypothetical protein